MLKIILGSILTLAVQTSGMSTSVNTDEREQKATRLWEQLPDHQQRVLIKHAPRYLRAPDGKVYCAQVAQEREEFFAKARQARGERDAAMMLNNAPGIYCPRTRDAYASKAELYARICADIQANWEVHARTTRQAALDKVEGEFVERMEVVQVLKDGLLVRFDVNKESGKRTVRLDGYPHTGVVVDGDRLQTNMKVQLVGRYQYGSAIGAIKTVERYQFIKAFDWTNTPPPPTFPAEKFDKVQPEELALALAEENWRGLPEWVLMRVKTSDGQEGGETWIPTGDGWNTTYRKVNESKAVPPSYEWRWVLRTLPLRLEAQPDAPEGK